MSVHVHLPLLTEQRFDEFLAVTAGRGIADTEEGAGWRKLAAHMRVMQVSQPALYLMLAPQLVDYVPQAEDLPTPLPPASQLNEQALYRMLADDQSAAFCGAAAWPWLAKAVAANLFQDGRVPVFHAVAPTAAEFFDVLRQVNWTRAPSPLVHPGTFFWIGPEWLRMLEEWLARDPLVAPPKALVGSSQLVAPLHARMQALREKRRDQTSQRIEFRAAELEVMSSATLIRLITQKPSNEKRRRVLLVGSRYAQHGGLDLASASSAFRKMGWQTEEMIEDRPIRRITRHAVARVVNDFKPHLVVDVHQPVLGQPEALPANLPLVVLHHGDPPATASNPACLMRIQVADALGERHLAMKPSPKVYFAPGLCAHPEAQRGLEGPMDVADVHSAGLSAMGGRRVYMLADAPPPAAQILERLKTEVAALPSGAGRNLLAFAAKVLELRQPAPPSIGAVRALMAKLVPDLDPAEQERAAAMLMPAANAAHLLGTAAMVQALADDLDLTLALYGSGWGAHEAFASSAKSAPRSRDELIRIIRQGAFALHASSGCLINQDYLDLVSCGALVLVRHHPVDLALRQMAEAILKAAPKAQTVADLGAIADPARRQAAEKRARQLIESLPAASKADPVALTRQAIGCGLFDRMLQFTPGQDQVSFDSPDTLRERIRGWSSARPGEREALVKHQQQAMVERLGLDSHLRRAMRALAEADHVAIGSEVGMLDEMDA